MIRKFIKPIQLLLILLFGCLAAAQGQEAAAKSRPELSAEKRALIKELSDVTNSGQIAETMFNAQYDEMVKQMPEMQWQTISRMETFKKLTPAQRQELRARSDATMKRFGNRIKEMFLQRINLKQLTEDVSYEVYDRHFTENELRDLVAFYKSATGKKVIEEMPALLSESVARAAELIEPKSKEIMEEIQKSETKQLADDIEQLLKSMPKPTPPKKPTTSRRRH